MDGRAEVVQKSRKGEGESTRAAAGLRFGFEDFDLQPRLRQHDGRGQAVGACSDDNRAALGYRHKE